MEKKHLKVFLSLLSKWRTFVGTIIFFNFKTVVKYVLNNFWIKWFQSEAEIDSTPGVGA